MILTNPCSYCIATKPPFPRASDAEAWPAGPDRVAGRANSERRSVTATAPAGAAPQKDEMIKRVIE